MIVPPKKVNYLCLDFEMSDLTSEMRKKIHGLTSEIIQIGVVLLDEKFNLISTFSAFVKPQFSHINSIIQNLTGITEADLSNAKTFVPTMEEFLLWKNANVERGAEALTFSWSRSDYTQLKLELNFKARSKKDLYVLLDNFIDLQKTFGKLLSANSAISLSAATQFSNVVFKGKQHSALSDSYNTACILHKICSAKKLFPQFDFLGKSNIKFSVTKAKTKSKKKNSKLLQKIRKLLKASIFRSNFHFQKRLPQFTKKTSFAKYGIPAHKFAEFRMQTFFVPSLKVPALYGTSKNFSF